MKARPAAEAEKLIDKNYITVHAKSVALTPCGHRMTKTVFMQLWSKNKI
jgi:hypothetical protein